ncbi:MAG TPA: DUF3048 domain-containing protein [Pseudogracilibacillus sp.]|nr:DUF3048 domain-containing protein [Pseudogracilibacillus sp.]
MKRSYMWGVVLFLISILSISACGEDNNSSQDTEEEHFAPFTGEAIKEENQQRAVAVMMDNQEKARPQSGLSEADMVFELLAEGDITRFMALYQNEEPEVVGPVRSAREYFFDIADGYDSLYVFSGAANDVFDELKKRDMDYLEAGTAEEKDRLFTREGLRKAPHNLYLQFPALFEIDSLQSKVPETSYESLPFLQEDESMPEEMRVEEASHAEVDMFDDAPEINFDYDEASELYTRVEQKETTIELESEKPIQMKNVLIAETKHDKLDDEGRRKIDIETGGDATLLQEGEARDVSWENQDGRIIPVSEGEEVPFLPGKTWVMFVPEKATIDLN